MMRILLLGKYGQLGWELHRCLGPLGEVIALDYPEIDLSLPDQALQAVRQAKPQVIVNASAYTAVDRAESEPHIAQAINARTPGALADEARRCGAALIHYSTDYVFDGSQRQPYVESDAPNPLGVYGQSKLDGERAVQGAAGAYLILRTSWVYSLRRDSFVTKVLQWSRQQTSLRIVSDQVGNPTWARMLAEATAQLLAKAGPDYYGWLEAHSGLYHLAGSGFTSRLEWCKAVLRLDPQRDQQTAHQVLPAYTRDFPTPAQRPLFSALDCDLFSRTFGLRLPDWEQALQLAMSAGDTQPTQ
jgi:dTDP-4-dehydrorhamnose reductase